MRAWLEKRLDPLGLTLADFGDGPVEAPGSVEVAFADGVFPTPSGKIELHSAEAARRWGVDPLPRCRLPEESAAGPAPDPRTTLQLLTPNTKNRIHSQFNNLETIRAVSPGPELLIHPADARDRSIENGARVRVFNDRGELEVEARFDGGIKRGCVSMTNGWWITQGGTVNFLSFGRETDMGHGAAFHDNLVQVENAG